MAEDTKDKAVNLTREDLLAAIRELKAPTVDEQEKIEAAKRDKERKKVAREEMLKTIAEEKLLRENTQKQCSHRKPDGTMNYKGQVHGDNPHAKVVLICGTCMKVLVNRPASNEDITHGPLELLVENQGFMVRMA